MLPKLFREVEPDVEVRGSCHKLEYVEYLDDLLLMSDQDERTDTVKEPLTDGTIAIMQTRLNRAEKGGMLQVREQEIALYCVPMWFDTRVSMKSLFCEDFLRTHGKFEVFHTYWSILTVGEIQHELKTTFPKTQHH